MAESALLSSVNSIKRLRPDKRKAFYFLVDFYSEPKTIFKLGAMYDFRYSIYGNHIPNRYSHSRLIFYDSIQSWGLLAFISFGKKVIRYEIITKINIITSRYDEPYSSCKWLNLWFAKFCTPKTFFPWGLTIIFKTCIHGLPLMW